MVVVFVPVARSLKKCYSRNKLMKILSCAVKICGDLLRAKKTVDAVTRARQTLATPNNPFRFVCWSIVAFEFRIRFDSAQEDKAGENTQRAIVTRCISCHLLGTP